MCNSGDHLRQGTLFANQEQNLPKKTVIAVVDDDDSVREALAGLVKSLGYSAAAFQRAEDFLASNRRDSTDCLIADVQMPGMTGPELHDRLVASGRPVPTILITAYPDETVRARVLQAGVKGYLSKPFREDELLECIRSALGSRSDEGRP
jgi:FixJ family two-component response regulator